MMMVDGKKITPVYGNMRPVEVRLNHQRLAGWVEESKQGESVDFADTYNHTADILIHGNSIQAGEPTPDAPIPVVSVEGNLVSRGKNLFDIGQWYNHISLKASLTKSIGANGEIILQGGPAGNYAFFTNDYRPSLLPNTEYTISIDGEKRFNYQVDYLTLGIIPHQDNVFYGHFDDKLPLVRGIIRKTFTTNAAGDCYLKGYIQFNNDAGNNTVKIYNIMLEEGPAGTDYEPFRGYNEISLPPLRKIGDVADTYNPATGELTQRIGKKVFDGVNTNVVKNDTNIGFYMYYGAFPKKHHNNEGVCTHFKPIVGSGYPETPVYEGQFTLKRHNTVAYFNFYGLVSGDNASLPNANEANAWLAAQYAAGTPLTVYYQLLTPVTTYLDPAPVPTYYPWTRIEQDGAVKGVIDATTKVIE